MRALVLSGHRGAALTQYDVCRQVLADELGVEPEAETVALVDQIRDASLAPPAKSVSGPVIPETPVKSDLPAVHTSVHKETPMSIVQPKEHTFPEGERRIITVVQAQVSGVESLLDRMGTEAWASIISQLLRAFGREVHRFGGEVDRYNEAGLLAFLARRQRTKMIPKGPCWRLWRCWRHLRPRLHSWLIGPLWRGGVVWTCELASTRVKRL
jgi:hypothetical protein